jgi:hypothetical protein
MRVLIGVLLVACSTAANLNPRSPVGASRSACRVLSSDPTIRTVQESRVFSEAIEAIRSATWQSDSVMPAEEVNRVCQSLKVVRPESLGGAVLVYARAFEAIEEVPVPMGA